MGQRKDYVRPIDFKHGRIDMTHGAGGRVAAQLIDELFARAFDNEYLRQGHDPSHGIAGVCCSGLGFNQLPLTLPISICGTYIMSGHG